jgi:hypothetical protein
MNKRLLFVPVLIFFTTISMAQEVPGTGEKKKKACSCAYGSLYNVGLLKGDAGGKLQLQTIQGVRYGKWFAGLGIGLDNYYRRSIPVFLDLRREILNRKNTPFVYGDAGINIPWNKKEQPTEYSTSTFRNGFYSDVGVGYRLAAIKSSAFVLSAGYSFTYLKQRGPVYPCAIDPCPANWGGDWRKNKQNRLSLKLGVQL